MLKVFLIFTLWSAVGKADKADPNGYFANRTWELNLSQGRKLKALSQYRAEPIQKPNQLKVRLHCKNGKTKTVIEKLKYCGIDSLKTIGGKLEIMFSDFNYKDSKGYCTKRRKQYFKLPSCK